MKKLTREEAIENFWLNVIVTVNECWEWQGSKQSGNWKYGFVKFEGKTWITSRLSWTLSYGPIPKKALICHKCNNPPCINPDHLYAGTPKDNSRDLFNTGYKPKGAYLGGNQGSKHPNAKLTEEQVKQIKQRIIIGTKQIPGNTKGLAQEFGVAEETIRNIIKGRTWTHVLV